jgi:hypothetical protein
MAVMKRANGYEGYDINSDVQTLPNRWEWCWLAIFPMYMSAVSVSCRLDLDAFDFSFAVSVVRIRVGVWSSRRTVSAYNRIALSTMTSPAPLLEMLEPCTHHSCRDDNDTEDEDVQPSVEMTRFVELVVTSSGGAVTSFKVWWIRKSWVAVPLGCGGNCISEVVELLSARACRESDSGRCSESHSSELG